MSHTYVKDLLTLTQDKLTGLKTWAEEKVPRVMNGVKAVVTPVTSRIEPLRKHVEPVLDAGVSRVDTTLDSAVKRVEAMKDVITTRKDQVKEKVMEITKNGEITIADVATAGRDAAVGVSTRVHEHVKTNVLDPVQAKVTMVQDKVRSVQSTVHTRVKSALEPVQGKVKTVIDTVHGKVDERFTSFLHFGDSAVEYVLPGEAGESATMYELGSKVKTRLTEKAKAGWAGVKAFSTKRQDVFHVDLIAYAEQIIDKSTSKVTPVFKKLSEEFQRGVAVTKEKVAGVKDTVKTKVVDPVQAPERVKQLKERLRIAVERAHTAGKTGVEIVGERAVLRLPKDAWVLLTKLTGRVPPDLKYLEMKGKLGELHEALYDLLFWWRLAEQQGEVVAHAEVVVEEPVVAKPPPPAGPAPKQAEPVVSLKPKRKRKSKGRHQESSPARKPASHT